VKTTAATVLACFQGALLLAKTRNDPGVIEQVGMRAVRMLDVPSTPGQKVRKSTPSTRRLDA
jgi:hypothetical protein